MRIVVRLATVAAAAVLGMVPIALSSAAPTGTLACTARCQ